MRQRSPFPSSARSSVVCWCGHVKWWVPFWQSCPVLSALWWVFLLFWCASQWRDRCSSNSGSGTPWAVSCFDSQTSSHVQIHVSKTFLLGHIPPTVSRSKTLRSLTKCCTKNDVLPFLQLFLSSSFLTVVIIMDSYTSLLTPFPDYFCLWFSGLVKTSAGYHSWPSFTWITLTSVLISSCRLLSNFT